MFVFAQDSFSEVFIQTRKKAAAMRTSGFLGERERRCSYLDQLPRIVHGVLRPDLLDDLGLDGFGVHGCDWRFGYIFNECMSAGRVSQSMGVLN